MNKKTPGSAGVIVALVLIGLGVRGAYWAFRDGRRGLESRNWPVASATVLSSALEPSSGPHDRTEWAADIDYSYAVSGVSYVGRNVSFPPRRGSQASAQAVVQRYKVGQTVSAHYDPSNPEQSCLEPGLDLWFLFAIPTVSLVLLTGGSWLAIYSLKSHGA